ncbi:MAG TPA: nicotianamine synthase family protein [Hyphomicrobiaceae bacterium]|nr:nicotianamine synthase family protein [Hyphomicrobiaceae bacterium]
MPTGRLIAIINEAYAALNSESDFSPANRRINAALSALVQGVMGAGVHAGGPGDDPAGVLEHPEVRPITATLRHRLALAEGAMERWWARRLTALGCVGIGDLARFPYWDCYRTLVAAELHRLPPGLKLHPGESVAVVGAGPLPLTAVLVHRLAGGLPVTCIDIDPEACRLARALIGKVGLAGLAVRCIDGARHDYASHPVVLVASLVPGKVANVRRIQATRPRALVALRSAEGLCTLLYEPVDEAAIVALGCGLLARTGHNPRVINTTLFYDAGAAPGQVGRGKRGADPTHPTSAPP